MARSRPLPRSPASARHRCICTTPGSRRSRPAKNWQTSAWVRAATGAGAAGFGLVAWGLGTEAPTAAEVQENFRQQMDLMRKPGTQAPATAGTETPAAGRLSRFFRRFELVSPVAWIVIDVPWRLRHPRRLTVLRDRRGSPNAVYSVLRAARAVQRRRPRIA